MSDTTNIGDMADRASKLVDAMANSMMAAAEAAAEKVRLASQVAQIRTRMEAHMSVLQIIGAQKAAVVQQLGRAGEGVQAQLLEHQLALLSQQEIGILASAGVPNQTAALVVAEVDGPAGGRRKRA